MTASWSPEATSGALMRRRVVRLMAARLGLLVGLLIVVAAVLGVGREGAETAERGIYGTLALGFAATLVFSGLFPFTRHPRRFAVLQLATDVGLVTSLVCFSGGADSLFSFLYLPATVYGSMLFDRRGAYGAAVGSSLGYGLALLVAERHGIRELFGTASPVAPLSALWVMHTAALLLVALLSSTLARELRATGEALEESATDLDRLRRLHERTVESLTSALLTTDSRGRVMSFNPEAERITGWTEAEVRGRDVEEIVPGVRRLVMTRAESEDPARRRARAPYRDRRGEQRHIGLAGSILRDADGSAAGHVVIFQDVSDVVEMEQHLRRSERLAAAGELSAAMAHEIRNPLAAISGSIEMLQHGGGGSPPAAEGRRLMGIVLREVERLDRLIAEFLQYARPAPAQPGPVELGTLVREVMEMFAAQQPPEVEVRIDVAPGSAVQADPRQLRQLLWNLVLNAAQAMPAGGRLDVSARSVASDPQGAPATDRNDRAKPLEWVEITVSDTGPGIPPEVLERIFDPFFTTKRGGSGLGLATVHRVAEGNGGVLRVESRVGCGTDFRVRFPAAEVSE